MRRFVLIAALLISGIAFADLPTTGYATAEATAANTITGGWTFIADLGDMPSEWWTEQNSTDGGRGRVFLDDGTTELAADFLFDAVAKTGQVRFLLTTTYSSVTETTIRIYPPHTGNSLYAADATFGSENAYQSGWEGYWRLDEDVNTDVNGYADSTRNADHGQGVSMAETEVAGQVGIAQDFDGSADRINIPDSATTSWWVASDTMTVSAWVFIHSWSEAGQKRKAIVSKGNFGGAFEWQLVVNGTDTIDIGQTDHSIGVILFNSIAVNFLQADSAADTLTLNTWYHISFVYDLGDTTELRLYINSVEVGSDSTPGSGAMAGDTATIGIGIRGSNSAFAFDGLIDEVHGHSDAWSVDKMFEEFSQTDDPPTYWGTWTWTASGSAVPALQFQYRQRRAAGVELKAAA